MFNLKKSKTHRNKIIFVLIISLLMSLISLAQADSQPARPDRPLPASVAANQLDSPLSVSDANALLKINESLQDAEGTLQVVVRLSEPSVSQTAVNVSQSRFAQASQRDRVRAQQAAFIADATSRDADARVLGNTRIALNAVMMSVDAAVLTELAANPDVLFINPVVDYEMDLSETVPYIGATAVQNLGYDGTGISVAVLDSGIDYYHADLGGSGDPDDYANDDPSIIEPGTFPTDKVVGGYDFVGSDWVAGLPTVPDPDPLDDGPGAGHGTHVAHIIGGVGGVAPGADLYALKVCSSISTSCSGVALLQAMDFALDPNGDGFVDDAVDIINMSLGVNYGIAFDDDLSFAVDNATALGVLTVSSAGNGSDKPFVTGSPSNAPTALSVAQTNVPSAFQPLMELTAPPSVAGLYGAVFQPWSAELTSVIEAPVLYGNGAGGNLDGCAAFTTDLSGYIVLVDRGGCNFTLKIKNIGDANGLIGIIGLIAPGDPFSGGDGGDAPITIPGYMISQADSNVMKSALPDTVAKFDPDTGIPLIGHMVGSSSRGPASGSNLIKPEIGAPGASVSAIAGTGTGTGPFGGTSGASPMVAGAAALLMQAYPDRAPLEIKAVLINTGDTNIINNAELGGGVLAPITRIGGGEIRVDQALDSPAAAWDANAPSAALSFGFHDVSTNQLILRRTVVVHNYSNARILYEVKPTFRYQDDVDNGAVDIKAPAFVSVPANGSTSFQVRMQINASLLRDWTMNSGSLGADPGPLTSLEYDGYIWLDNVFSTADDDNPLHLPWQVLPRVASDVRVFNNSVNINSEYLGIPAGSTKLRNAGAATAMVESYSLIGVSPNLPEGGPGEQNPTPDFRYLGYATIPVPAGFCSGNDSFLLQFAINTWERQSHANTPNSFWINLDVDQDPTTGGGPFGSEYSILSRDFSLTSLSDGRNLTWVVNWATGGAGAFFFTDHDTNSGNTVLTICGEQIGMNAANFFDPMDVTAQTTDFLFGGAGDILSGITISPLGEQYLGVFESGGIGFTEIPSHGLDRLHVLDFGPSTNNTETGLLLLYRDGTPAHNEANIVLVNP